MLHIGAHLKRTLVRKRETERGELMRYFCERLNSVRRVEGFPEVTMPHMGFLLTNIPTKDLYYLKRVCDDAPNFSKKFWWEIEPKNHTQEAKATQEKKFKQARAKKWREDNL